MIMESSFSEYLQSNAQISDNELLQLQSHIRTRTVGKGEFLLRKGEVCKHSFFVESGLLRSYSIDKDGKVHIIQFAPENWFVSDRGSIYFNEPSSFFIDAVEATQVVMLDEAFVITASQISLSFRQYNEQILQNHIRHMQNRINLLLGASAEERYLDFINLYPDLTLRVPQWMIASYLGITPESLSRVRKALAKQNFEP
ncbi:cAMP-binding domain of CRP or a regulatory subunit of cAMP-dependent protein kinases [Reichenbachiella faecimaris]|uniref:cAMP-binding domain of CRP or a regulatory subunit of cAMP-dependent protein kinases n=2 Tax=Reichenbachiella faecimaris TaxID=692418 RepID=A0A1W2GNT4_REIFA|nr:cAMP-binding domain of CRP or a regulatory subunit of cAMP-dependent protein kinases [Reichenbachiella faecimaris]